MRVLDLTLMTDPDITRSIQRIVVVKASPPTAWRIAARGEKADKAKLWGYAVVGRSSSGRSTTLSCSLGSVRAMIAVQGSVWLKLAGR